MPRKSTVLGCASKNRKIVSADPMQFSVETRVMGTPEYSEEMLREVFLLGNFYGAKGGL